MVLEASFVYTPPTGPRLPLLISVPHCGTDFPKDERALFRDEVIQRPEDTDWFVHFLYDNAPEMGIGLLRARYSRYIVDLNRDPAGAKLYNDGRPETAVVPTKTFAGQPLYKDAAVVNERLVAARHAKYFLPYHEEVRKSLSALRADFANVLFFDAHSIKRLVPAIRPLPFPDLILGNQEGRTCDGHLLEKARQILADDHGYDVALNEPFKGGYLTRHFGDPKSGIHALQLEMAQDVYMDEETCRIDKLKHAKIKRALEDLLEGLARVVEGLK